MGTLALTGGAGVGAGGVVVSAKGPLGAGGAEGAGGAAGVGVAEVVSVDVGAAGVLVTGEVV